VDHQIEEGKLELSLGEVDVPQMMASVGRQFEATLVDKHISLEVVVDPRVPQMLVGDCIRLRQVLPKSSVFSIFFTLFLRSLVGSQQLAKQCY
jgi:hypothetical protein